MASVSSTDRSSAVHTLDSHRRPVLEGPPPGAVRRVRALVCHPAALAGHAIAATLRTRPGIAQVAAVTSVTDVLRELLTPWDVALVSETVGDDLRELLQALCYRGLALPVVVLADDPGPETAARHLEWGAAGGVDLGRPVPVLLRAIQLAAAGAPVVDDRIAPEIVECLHERAAHRGHTRRVLQSLTPRERQVIESLARGTGVTAIAERLHLSPHTIRACIQTLGPKLGVSGQLQIASVARELLTSAQAPAPSRYLENLLASGRGSLPLSS